MAFNFQTWQQILVYILLAVFLFQECCILLTCGFLYSDDTQDVLCRAQCEAGCLDKLVSTVLFSEYLVHINISHNSYKYSWLERRNQSGQRKPTCPIL